MRLIASVYTDSTAIQKPKSIKGCSAASNAASRFVEFTRETIDDGWEQGGDEAICIRLMDALDEALQPEDLISQVSGFMRLKVNQSATVCLLLATGVGASSLLVSRRSYPA